MKLKRYYELLVRETRKISFTSWVKDYSLTRTQKRVEALRALNKLIEYYEGPNTP
jgi:hypothetical protein